MEAQHLNGRQLPNPLGHINRRQIIEDDGGQQDGHQGQNLHDQGQGIDRDLDLVANAAVLDDRTHATQIHKAGADLSQVAFGLRR